MAISRRVPAIARVLLRLPGALHRSLTEAAGEAGLSFNEYCVRRLSVPALPGDVSELRSLVVDRSLAVFGPRLEGVVLTGSFARQRASTDSDIDVLIAIDPGVALARDLYRAWDEHPLTQEGRVIDAHFAHLPTPGTPPGAVWCEAAVDGHVWYDRAGRTAARLGEARRAIANGHVVRAFAHGQPYWKGAA